MEEARDTATSAATAATATAPNKAKTSKAA
jgi:hypothetical protein